MQLDVTEDEYDLIMLALAEHEESISTYKLYLKDKTGVALLGQETVLEELGKDQMECVKLRLKLYDTPHETSEPAEKTKFFD